MVSLDTIIVMLYNYSMKIKEILKQLEQNGWYQVAQRGSHRQFKNDNIPGRVTVAGKPSDDIDKGTLNSILKQAKLKEL